MSGELPPPADGGGRLLFPGVSQARRAGVSSRGVAAGTGPAPAPRSARAPAARELGWDFPADAVCLFAEAALNFLSKLLIRYAVLCSCCVRANGSARLERLVTQGIVIREVRNISACPVQAGLYL